MIARAILKDAPVVVLDEATAFADPENEAKIQAAFKRLARGGDGLRRTVLMIAHRLSTVRNADLIVVVDKGRVVEHAARMGSCWRRAASMRACGPTTSGP